MFERNDYIGGRLKHIVLDGVTVEGTSLFFFRLGVREEVAVCLSLPRVPLVQLVGMPGRR